MGFLRNSEITLLVTELLLYWHCRIDLQKIMMNFLSKAIGKLIGLVGSCQGWTIL